MAMSAVLSTATVTSYILGIAFSLGDWKVIAFMAMCLMWTMSFGAVLCGARAFLILWRQAEQGRLRTVLGKILAVFLVGLGGLLTLAMSFLLYINSMPEK